MFSFIPDKVPEHLKFDIKSIPEEVANMISHGLGLLFALIAVPLLVIRSAETGSGWHIWAAVIYGVSLIMVYTSSTLYHSVYIATLRRKLRVFDHIAIYFLIAGSYTPFVFSVLRTNTGFLVIGILWSMVLIGTVFKLFYTHKFKVLSTVAYLVMGWMAVIIVEPIYKALPFDTFIWIAIGGAFYTFGVIFYLWRKLYHSHLIWHLFVLGGSISHFVAVYKALT